MSKLWRTTLAAGAMAVAVSLVPGYAQAEDEAASPGQEKLNEALALMQNDASVTQNRAEAETALKAAIQADPGLLDARFDLANLYYRVKDYEAAKTTLQELLASTPSFASGHALMGRVLEAQGQTDAATPYFTKSIELDRTNPIAHNAMAARSIATKSWPEAISHARQALVEDPDNMNSYLNLAIAYYNMEMLDMARLVCLNAIGVNPQSAQLHNVLGLVLLKKDDVRGAVVEFNKALQADPDMIDARMNAGSVTLSYSDFQAAFDHFDRVVQLAPNNTEAKLSRAVALRGLERFDEAKQAYADMLKSDPKDEKAQYNLCILYNEYLTEYQSALTECQRFYDMIGPDHPEKQRMAQRIEGIKATIEALGPTGAGG